MADGRTRARSVTQAPLVGRDDELSVLRDQLVEARRGRASVVVVFGEAGVGKSRLVDELVLDARRWDVRVLRGRAIDVPVALSYRPFLEAVGPVAERSQLALLSPDAGRDHAGAAPSNDAATVRLQLLQLLDNVTADGPAVVVLEDLHWSDDLTVEAVEFLATVRPRGGCLLIATVRTEAATQAERRLRALVDSGAAVGVQLERLSSGETEQLVGALLEGATAAIVERAAGLPLAAVELATHAGSEGVLPESFARLASQRLDTLGSDARAAVALAAILGQQVDWGVLAWLLQREAEETVAQLDHAVDAGLLEPAGDAYQFRHALIRDAVLNRLARSERVAVAAGALRVIGGERRLLTILGYDVVANLQHEAGQRHEAAATLLAAARASLRRGVVPSEELLATARALAAGDVGLIATLDECAAEGALASGDAARSRAAAAASIASLHTAGASATRLAEARMREARALLISGDLAAASASARMVREMAPDLRSRALLVEAEASVAQDDTTAARAAATAALDHATQHDDFAGVCAAYELIARCDRVVRMEDAAPVLERMHAVAESHGLEEWRLRALLELGIIDAFTTGTMERLELARAAAIDSGSLATVATIDVQCAVRWIYSDVSQARAPAESAYQLARRLGLPIQGIALALIAMTEAGLDAERVESRLAELEGLPLQSGRLPGHSAAVRGMYHAFHEEWDDALRQFDLAVEQAGPLGRAHAAAWRGLWTLLRTVHAADGGRDARQELREAGVSTWPNEGLLALADAVDSGRRGDVEDAERHLQFAVARLEPFENLRALGLRLTAEAAMADGWGDVTRMLDVAATAANSTNQPHTARAVRALQRRAGVKIRRRGRGDATVPEHLAALGVTSREMDVLLLVAHGCTNAQIADQLSMSVRTVETHVSKLLAKTAAGSRVALAGTVRAGR